MMRTQMMMTMVCVDDNDDDVADAADDGDEDVDDVNDENDGGHDDGDPVSAAGPLGSSPTCWPDMPAALKVHNIELHHDDTRSPRCRWPRTFSARILWETGKSEDQTFQYLHHRAWRDAYASRDRRLVLKAHVAPPGGTAKLKPFTANGESIASHWLSRRFPNPKCMGASMCLWTTGRTRCCRCSAPTSRSQSS